MALPHLRHFLPDLLGGADAYGTLTTVNALSIDFANILASAPGDAVGAILREHIGPTGEDNDFTGYDALLFINLTSSDLANAAYGDDLTGLDPLFRQVLLAGGTQKFWGGGASSVLSGLSGYAVYER